MAISMLRITFNLLWLVLIVPCQLAVIYPCNYGKYWDIAYGRCRDCSPCPKDVILGTSRDYSPMYDCKQYKSLCPNWCSVESASRSNPNEGRDACMPTTPSPPVPYVNITIEEPQYNSTANACTVSCTASYRDMGTRTLEWYDPSGQLLAPNDTSGKWKVTEEGVTPEVMSTTLLMKDFKEGDEGYYTCAARGAQSDNRTIFLEYVPYVNITIEEPQYNSTANACTVLCTASYSRDMGTRTLEWYDPSGQLLAPNDTSGKWKVTEEGVTPEVMSTTLLMKDFKEGDEGPYTCATRGAQSDNRTIFLEYGGLSTPSIIGISVAVSVGVAVVLCLSFVSCAFLCTLCILKRRYTLKRTSIQRSRVTVADTEAHALTGYSNNFVDKLILETSDFKSAMVKGIQACLDQTNCEAVIIKKNGKKIGKVRTCSNQDAFFIEPLAWNDSIEVWKEYPHRNIWMKYFQGDNELIKTLKMKCLKIANVAETSALIYSPSVENTFYMRFEETNAPSSSSSSARPEDLMCGGSKEMCNLRPSVTYCVQLGIKGQTGDSGDYKWHWTEEFTTRSITVQSVTYSETSAKLTLNEYLHPVESVQLYYEINQAKPVPMKSAQISISSLIPGMEQVLQIKVKENVRCTPAFRLLQEKIFTTSGSVEDGGDYRGCATTDCPNSDPEEELGPSNGRRKKPSRTNVPTKCHTGLLEAIHALQDSDKFKQVYLHTEQRVVEAVLESLMEFLKDHKDFIPNDKYVLNANRKQWGMKDIEGFMKLYAMQDYTGIFDLLKRFIRNDRVHTQAGVSFAEQLLDAHSSDLRTCQVCKHAVYLLRRYAERHSHQPSVC